MSGASEEEKNKFYEKGQKDGAAGRGSYSGAGDLQYVGSTDETHADRQKAYKDGFDHGRSNKK